MDNRHMSHPPALEADLRAIAALNAQDMKAIMESDVSTITSQWTDDFVVLPSTGPIVRGRAANVTIAEAGKAQLQAIEPVEYVVNFEEISVNGDYAFEWGTYRGRMRPRAGGDTVAYSGKLMRILQRQPDGSWKMHRTMLTLDPPASLVAP
jgi:ketosteroid isomerase-like protein